MAYDRTVTVGELRELIEGLDDDTRVVIREWNRIDEAYRHWDPSEVRVTVARLDNDGHLISETDKRLRSEEYTEITILEIVTL